MEEVSKDICDPCGAKIFQIGKRIRAYSYNTQVSDVGAMRKRAFSNFLSAHASEEKNNQGPSAGTRRDEEVDEKNVWKNPSRVIPPNEGQMSNVSWKS